ncbi:MAG TPA: hypothetical protein PKD90_05220 [Phnomibacter sp.]|nr:hypothetical protein [Phnomibacter sp.]
MMKYLIILVSTLTLGSLTSQAQKVEVSQPDRNEARQTNFEIIGKYADRYLVYKNYRNNNYISVYNDKMELVENVQMPYMPNRLIEATFLSYPTHSYLFYQYNQKGIVHAMMVKLGPDGKNLTEPIELDTTQVNTSNDVKVYSITPSDDKNRIMVFKVNSRNEKRYLFKTFLYDRDMNLLHSTQRLGLEMRDRNDYLTDFYLDNEGNLVFGRGLRSGPTENIAKFYLVQKPAKADTFSFSELTFDNISLDEVKLRIDNYNNRYLFTGFYYRGRKANIEGISNAVYEKKSGQWIIKNIIPLDGQLREDARGQNSSKNSFDDYYIREINIRSDGAFLLSAEALYQTSRGGNFNRWNNMYSPWMTPMDFYRWGGWSPYGAWGWGSPWGWGGNNITRYHADNIVVLAFDKEGKLLLSNTIYKSQFDDNNDAMVSYQSINTGNGLQFLYNEYDKRGSGVVMSYQTLTPEGRVIRNPTIKGLSRDYSFMPKYARQVALRTVIVPCLFRNSLCFARLELPA